tara:strand:- start:643 stop:879 length:237 start_codon:yes stop_codon:yes gene_type:complete
MATVNYTEEFKKEAVKLLLESDLPKAKLASNLGVKYSTLMTWYYKSMQKSPAKSNSIDYKSNANQGLKNNQDNCQHMC